MGVSTNAMVYLGFDIYDVESGECRPPFVLPNEEQEGFDRWEVRTWFKDISDEVWAEINSLVEFHYHCCIDYPIWFICAKGSFQVSFRGYPHSLFVHSPEDIEEFKDNLRKACRILGMEFREEDLTFKLASYWG